MDNERRDSISDRNKWEKDYSLEDIMSREEALKAVYADKSEAENANTAAAPTNNSQEKEPAVEKTADKPQDSTDGNESEEDISDEVFEDWADSLTGETDAENNYSDEDRPAESEEVSAKDESGNGSGKSGVLTGAENSDGESKDADAEPQPESAGTGVNGTGEETGAESPDGEAKAADSESQPESAGTEVNGTEENGTGEETGAENSDGEPKETDAESQPESAGTEENGTEEETGAENDAEAKPPVPIDPEKEKKRRMIIGGVAGILVLAAIIGSQVHKHYKEFYTTHFFSGTVINGMDASKKTVDEVKKDIKDNVSHYSLTIKELNRNEKITAGNIGLEYVDDGKVDELMEEQEEGKWFLHLTGGTDFEINAGTKYDENKVTETIAGLECFKEENVTKPQDATLRDENNVFSIQDEVEGNEVNLEKFTAAVKKALDKGETSINIVKDDCYNHPSVYRNDETLKARMDKWNEYMRVNVTYAFGDNIEVVNGDTVKPNVVDDGTNVDLPTDWIRTLVYGWGQKYDTFGLAREFTTHSGEVVMVEEGGDYGWVIDKDVTIADVTDAILTGAQGERTPTFLYSAMGWDNGDLTGTYVEVSISEQHLWCYKDYELVMDTDVVTGLPTPERGTTRGCFAVDAKKEDAVLGSLDVQGYASPVSFWAPFNGGQGLHDAPWRDDFGGDIYLGNGSHGCVNIPPWNMETIYNAIDIGTAVVIY